MGDISALNAGGANWALNKFLDEGLTRRNILELPGGQWDSRRGVWAGNRDAKIIQFD